MAASRSAPQSSSLFSSVFSLVARELESFVTNATGGVLPEEVEEQIPQSPAAKGHKRHTLSSAVHDHRHAPEPRLNGSETLQTRECLPHQGDASVEDRLPTVNATTQLAQLPGTSSSTSPPLCLSRRRMSMTMPGSLFSRSPSIEPDGSRNDVSTPRRVRFATIPTDLDPPPPSTIHDLSTQPRIVNLNGETSALTRQVKLHPPLKDYVDGCDCSSNTIEREYSGARQTRRDIRGRTQHNPSNKPPDIQDFEQERVRDKERIRILEGEIQKLKEELSNRSTCNQLLLDIHDPPPPPPPPPLPRQAAHLRIPPASSTPGSMFRSVRAALKHTPTPVEAPINPPPVNAQRKGHPTVGLAPDLMASFLSELKTVRLRKVSGPSGARAECSRPASGSGIPVHPIVQNSSTRRSNNIFTPFSESARAGTKRKRVDDPCTFREAEGTGLKRISLPPPLNSSLYIANHQAEHLLVPSLSTQPQVNTTFQGGATPSLCSDNSLEREDDAQFDEPPSTPSTGPILSLSQESYLGAISVERGSEVIDVDLLPDEPHVQGAAYPRMSPILHPPSISDSSQPSRRIDIFTRRPPTSPLPAQSPRKPPPPRTARVAMLSTTNKFDDTTPSLIERQRYLATHAPAALIPRESIGTKSRRMAPLSPRPSKVATFSKQRTLDEELRSVSEQDFEPADLELDLFTSSGTRPQDLGFLAHGGAGGPPVFLGVGYITGAQDPPGKDTTVCSRQRHGRVWTDPDIFS